MWSLLGWENFLTQRRGEEQAQREESRSQIAQIFTDSRKIGHGLAGISGFQRCLLLKISQSLNLSISPSSSLLLSLFFPSSLPLRLCLSAPLR
jgi:hypothetical protein